MKHALADILAHVLEVVEVMIETKFLPSIVVFSRFVLVLKFLFTFCLMSKM